MSESEFKQRRGEQLNFSQLKGVGKFNLVSFVNQVSDMFEVSRNREITISAGARKTLVQKMAPHIKDLRTDLSTGKMTIKKLAKLLTDILNEAGRSGNAFVTDDFKFFRTTIQSRSIEPAFLEEIMKKKCHYLGWC